MTLGLTILRETTRSRIGICHYLPVRYGDDDGLDDAFESTSPDDIKSGPSIEPTEEPSCHGQLQLFGHQESHPHTGEHPDQPRSHSLVEAFEPFCLPDLLNGVSDASVFRTCIVRL